MKKSELIDSVAAKTELPKVQVAAVIQAVLETTKETLEEGDNLVLVGFGTFKVADRAARKTRNPRTGKAIDIPACKVVKFVPGKFLKEAVNK